MNSKFIGSRFGYSDDDLSTPGHDALVLWAQKNWWSLVERHILPWAREKAEERRRRLNDQGEVQSEVEKDFGWYRPTLEVKCSAGGWIDLLGQGYAAGPHHGHWLLAVEVKTTIRSLGELIRQLRNYESHQPPGGHYYWQKKIVVLSPDSRFREAIESQGFGFHWVCMDAIKTDEKIQHSPDEHSNDE